MESWSGPLTGITHTVSRASRPGPLSSHSALQGSTRPAARPSPTPLPRSQGRVQAQGQKHMLLPKRDELPLHRTERWHKPSSHAMHATLFSSARRIGSISPKQAWCKQSSKPNSQEPQGTMQTPTRAPLGTALAAKARALNGPRTRRTPPLPPPRHPGPTSKVARQACCSPGGS